MPRCRSGGLFNGPAFEKMSQPPIEPVCLYLVQTFEMVTMSDQVPLSDICRRSIRLQFLLLGFVFILSTGVQAQLTPSEPIRNQNPATGVEKEKAPLAEDEDDFFKDEFEFGDLEDGTAPAIIADPLEPVNRAIFVFNDKFYFWILKPITKGYRWVLPSVARTGVSNFFVNLFTPIRFTNALLQGKFDSAGTIYARFVTNTSLGVLGFGNPAKNLYNLEKQDEDFGQTLGVYGVGNGFFVMLPFLGPSSLRDGLAIIPDWYLSPITYIVDSTTITLGLYFLRTVNETSFRLGDYEAIKEAALDPYAAIRDGYIQFRRAKILD